MRSGMFGKVRINWLNILSSYTCLYFSRPATRLPFFVQPDAGMFSFSPSHVRAAFPPNEPNGNNA